VIDREKHECHIQLIKDSLIVNLDKAATKWLTNFIQVVLKVEMIH
jgi:hypothetical protein